jgi:predicted RNA-binding Zn ribbon-like protein
MVVRWSWLGDALAVDWANTVRRRGAGYIDLLTRPADLELWLEHESARVPVIDVDDAVLERFTTARDHGLEVLRWAATGRVPAPEHGSFINGLVLAAPTARLLGKTVGEAVTYPLREVPGVERLLGTLAQATIDLVTGAEREDLALCDAPGCGQLYFRGRRNQEWCNPACGTRARVERHHLRHGDDSP